MLKSKKFLKIVIIIITITVLILTSISVVRYLQAPEIAENTLAIYLAKEYRGYHFRSFNEVYSTVKFKNFKYVIELSGSINSGINNNRSFYSKVTVSIFTNDIDIKKLTINGENWLKS